MAEIHEILAYDSPAHAKLLALVNDCEDLWESYTDTLFDRMKRADMMDRLYVSPEDHADLDKGTKTLSQLDFSQPVIVPYSKVCLDTVHSVLVQTFLTRRSLWSLMGRSPDDMDPARIIQIDLDYQLDWTRSKLALMAIMRDMLRYGHGVGQTKWRKEMDTILTWQAGFDEMGRYAPQEVEVPRHLFEGNELRYIHPRQFIHDPRVPLGRFQEGQFAGIRVKMPYFELYKDRYREETGDGVYFNLKEALNSSVAKTAKRADSETANEVTGGEPLAESADSRQDEKNPMCSITEMMIEIIPSEYDLPWGDEPRKILIAVANEEVITRCARNPYGHNRYPFDAAQQQVDLEGLYSPGMLQMLEGLQDVANYQVNAHIESTLQQLRNLTFIDPQFVDENEFLNPTMNQVIRLGRSIPAYASIDTHIAHQQRLHVPTQSLLNDSGFIFDQAMRLTGATDSVQGSEGRTRTTARESTQRWHGSMRMIQMLALSFGMQFIEPLGRKWVANTQKLRTVREFRRIQGEHLRQYGMDENAAGIISAPGNQQFIMVDPALLRRAVIDIIPTDASRAMNPVESPEIMKEVVGMIGASPLIAAEFDIIGAVIDVFRVMGFPNPERYRRTPEQKMQMMMQQRGGAPAVPAPDQAVAQQVQAGNLVEVPQTVQ